MDPLGKPGQGLGTFDRIQALVHSWPLIHFPEINLEVSGWAEIRIRGLTFERRNLAGQPGRHGGLASIDIVYLIDIQPVLGP